MINDQLYEYLDVFVVAYLDDILIYFKIENEHIQHVKKVLAKLRVAKFFLNPKKCEFHREETHFLGFIVGRYGIRIDSAKVEAVLTWLELITVTKMQSFLGFANFYRRFIHNYSAVAKALTDLIKKDKEFKWVAKVRDAFRTLKERFTQASVLATYDPDLEIVMETDASDFALGACLS